MVQSRAFLSPPFPVERSLKALGTNIRIARLRRNLTINDIAERIGTNRKSVMDAERGKASTGIGVYLSILWALGLLDQFNNLADPSQDKEETRASDST